MNRALLLLLLAGPPALAAPFPGGILDATGKTAFVAGAKGIDAIDLATGEARWRSTHAQRPLFIAGDTLFALAYQADSFAVVGLDKTGKGETVFRSGKVKTPAWAKPSGAAGQAFGVVWIRQKQTLVVSWRARQRGRRGKEARGSARVDLINGRVEPLGEARHEAPPLALPPMLEKLSVRWHRAVGGQVVAVTEEETAPPKNGVRSIRLLLRSWNERTGKEGPAKELAKGSRPRLIAGLDGLHLWVRDAGDPGAEEPEDWRVFSSLDGHAVGRVPFVAGTAQALLAEGRAYCLANASGGTLLAGEAARGFVLHAIDPKTGKETWTWRLSRHAVAE